MHSRKRSAVQGGSLVHARCWCCALQRSVSSLTERFRVPVPCSKLVALAERLRSFCQPLSTDPSTFGRLVKISSEILVLIDAACYAAAAYSAVLHARALQHQLSAEEVASARAACTALDAGAAALRHMSHSASAGGLLGRGISAQNHMAQELSVRLLMQLQAAAILRQLAYPAVEPEDGVAPDAPPATFQQGRWVLSYSMTCGVLYAWTPTSPQRPGAFGRDCRRSNRARASQHDHACSAQSQPAWVAAAAAATVCGGLDN